MKKDLKSLFDLSKDEVLSILERGRVLKRLRSMGVFPRGLSGKKIALIFEKPSTRTRVSFEVGVWELGGYPLYIDTSTTQMKRGEPPKDVARVLSRYVDGLVIRTFGQERLEEFCAYSSVPVINALTDKFHPCQILADLMTIEEEFGSIDGVTVAYLGDGNNIANSWVAASSRVPIKVVVMCPKGFEPDSDVIDRAKREGGDVFVSNDPSFVKEADVVYTDVWVSMGSSRGEEVKRFFEPFRVDRKLFSMAGERAIFLHCLPAHRGEEVTDEIIEHPRSRVFDQAENRLHVQKALMLALFSGDPF